MSADGKTVNFNQISNAGERSLFEGSIPSEFAGGSFLIEAKFKDGTSVALSTVKVVAQSNYYNPAADFAGISATSITLFALLTLWNSSDSPAGRRAEEDEEKAELSGVDTNSAGKDFVATNKMRRSFLASYILDEFRNLATISLSRYSPMPSRLVSDGSYLQYFLGGLSLMFPALGALLGYLAHQDIQGYGYVTRDKLIALSHDNIKGLGVFINKQKEAKRKEKNNRKLKAKK